MSTPSVPQAKPAETDEVNQLEHFEVANAVNTTKKEFSPIDESWLASEKRLVRKLDMTLMPMVWVLYLFNYLDRNNIAFVPSQASATYSELIPNSAKRS